MIKVNAIGDTCPIPVIKTKNAIKECKGAEEIHILVDNEIAVQNLTKMANQKGYPVSSVKNNDDEFEVIMKVEGTKSTEENVKEEAVCIPDHRKKKTVVVLRSDKMGEGEAELGKMLMKGFVFALTQQDILPETILMYNQGASLSCEGSDSLEDLKSLEAQGVEILTCGTCLNFYGLAEKLQVGSVTNMYVIAEKMMNADHIVTP